MDITKLLNTDDEAFLGKEPKTQKHLFEIIFWIGTKDERAWGLNIVEGVSVVDAISNFYRDLEIAVNAAKLTVDSIRLKLP